MTNDDIRSSDSVKFRDLQPLYGLGDDIFAAVEYARDCRVTCGDWIGLFPAGWTQLDQFLGYQKAPQPARNSLAGHQFLYSFVFKTKAIPMISYQDLHQFVFVSQKRRTVLGVSSNFALDSNSNYLEYSPSPFVRATLPDYSKRYSGDNDLSISGLDGNHIWINKAKEESNLDEFMHNTSKQNLIEKCGGNNFQGDLVQNEWNQINQLSYEKEILQSLLHRQEIENEYLKANFKAATEYNVKFLTDVQLLIERLQIAENQMDKNCHHIRDLYRTLNQQGFESIHLNNGEQIDLTSFQGSVLKLERRKMLESSYFHQSNFDPYKNEPSVNNEDHSKSLFRKLSKLQNERSKFDDYLQWLQSESLRKNVKSTSFLSKDNQPTKSHIYDDPYSDSSCDGFAESLVDIITPRSVKYSKLKTLKIQMPIDEDFFIEKSKKYYHRTTSTKVDDGSRSSRLDEKKKRNYAKEHLITNFIDKHENRQVSTNPFLPTGNAFDTSSSNDLVQNKSSKIRSQLI